MKSQQLLLLGFVPFVGGNRHEIGNFLRHRIWRSDCFFPIGGAGIAHLGDDIPDALHRRQLDFQARIVGILSHARRLDHRIVGVEVVGVVEDRKHTVIVAFRLNGSYL